MTQDSRDKERKKVINQCIIIGPSLAMITKYFKENFHFDLGSRKMYI